MRLRTFLATASVLIGMASASAGLLDDFLAVVDARLTSDLIPRSKVLVLIEARDILRKKGLLLDDARRALRGARHVERIYPRDAEFDAAETALVEAVARALEDDRAVLAARADSISDPRAKARLATNLRRAAADLTRAAAARSPVPALERLLVAAGRLHDAFPPQRNFRIPDVNPNSATFGLPVSPRDDTGVRTAWYFVHGT